MAEAAFVSDCSRAMVVAIDFGTTYSGYAFSFRNEPLKIMTNMAWNSGSACLISLKTPTCILLSPEKKFHSFGYEAENTYCELIPSGQQRQWYFFRQFKMMLMKTKDLKKDAVLEDVSGKPIQALVIFSLSIRYFKDHLITELEKRGNVLNKDNIQFVLTIPAIWDDMAKRFMREAALQAGIKPEQLVLALEPEVASIYCQITFGERLKIHEAGSQYMVVDLGGGTVDITVHETQEDGGLTELYEANGGPWGGTSVDKEILMLIKRMTGEENMTKFIQNNTGDYIDFFRTLEVKKRSFSAESNENEQGKKTVFRCPYELIKLIVKQNNLPDPGGIAFIQLSKNVDIAADKLKIAKELVDRIFDVQIQPIIDHVRDLFRNLTLPGVNTILLIGGYAECGYVQKAFKTAFRDKRIVIPEEAGLAVLKGAVIFGHLPTKIVSRVARFTYGVAGLDEFDPSIHPPNKLKVTDTGKWCKDVFHQYVQKGQSVPVGWTDSDQCIPISNDQKVYNIRLYTSENTDPKYIDDEGCRLLGTYVVPIPREYRNLEQKRATRSLTFGETELRFELEFFDGKKFEKAFDMM